MYLFIDTTENITIGLLDDELCWVEYQYLIAKKSSAEIHFLIYEILKNNNLKLSELTAVFYSAGPGSYTGMRVSEGITNVFSWQDIKVYSFYHFKIPSYTGIANGIWLAKAFKGEFFLYSWQGDNESKELVLEKEVEEKLLNNGIYSGHIAYKDLQTVLTCKLIEENPKQIFKTILDENLVEELFYYRPLEEEFKRN